MHTQITPNTTPQTPPPPTTTEQMTDFMREHVALDRSVTIDDLMLAGFGYEDIIDFGPAAALAANKQFVRHLNPAPQPVRSPQQGANLIIGLMPKEADVCLALRNDGWSNDDIAKDLTEILAIAGDDFAALVPA